MSSQINIFNQLNDIKNDAFGSYPNCFTATSDTRRRRGMHTRQRSKSQPNHARRSQRIYTITVNATDWDYEYDLAIIRRSFKRIPKAALDSWCKMWPEKWNSYGICFASRQVNANGFPAVLAVRQKRAFHRNVGIPKGSMEAGDNGDDWACACREVFHEELYVPFDPPAQRPRKYKVTISRDNEGERYIHFFIIWDVDREQKFRIRDKDELHDEVYWFDIDNTNILKDSGDEYFTLSPIVKMLYKQWPPSNNGN
ncbi:unnamed protein product [Rotaria socialis]|uniref:Nudix hydrolase domain-containing protein n=1 Tax=Rotaria socialis TaxID=392032 RepID=A0A817UW55_9BILA|nr:unnamed protein product [Rotaria socialis]